MIPQRCHIFVPAFILHSIISSITVTKNAHVLFQKGKARHSRKVLVLPRRNKSHTSQSTQQCYILEAGSPSLAYRQPRPVCGRALGKQVRNMHSTSGAHGGQADIFLLEALRLRLQSVLYIVGSRIRIHLTIRTITGSASSSKGPRRSRKRAEDAPDSALTYTALLYRNSALPSIRPTGLQTSWRPSICLTVRAQTK